MEDAIDLSQTLAQIHSNIYTIDSELIKYIDIELTGNFQISQEMLITRARDIAVISIIVRLDISFEYGDVIKHVTIIECGVTLLFRSPFY